MKNKIDNTKWYCYHCNREIINKKFAWSRGRNHWCCKTCLQQDYSIERKKIYKEE